jgi:hypothetical protein
MLHHTFNGNLSATIGTKSTYYINYKEKRNYEQKQGSDIYVLHTSFPFYWIYIVQCMLYLNIEVNIWMKIYI